MSEQDQACFHMSGKLLDLMEKDPALKEAALANGMDPAKLETVQGMKVMHRMEQESREAEYQMTRAKVEGRELSAEEKKQYTKAILKSKIAVMRLDAENLENSNSEELKHDNKAPEIKLSKAAEKALQSIVKPEPEKKSLNSVEEIRKEAGFDENVIEKKNTIKDRA